MKKDVLKISDLTKSEMETLLNRAVALKSGNDKNACPLIGKNIGPLGTYYWCSCGKSEIAPYCDGSHSGSGKKPLEFSIRDFEEVSLCGCGRTMTPPYRDGSHAKQQ